MPRVVISGLGCMTALGADKERFFAGLAAGRSGIVAVGSESFAPLPAWNEADHFEPRRALKLDPYSQIALIAAREAVANAGLAVAQTPAARIAVIVGSAMAGKTTDDDNHDRLWRAVAEGRQAASHPMSIPRYMGNAAASQIGMEFGFTGPTFSLSSSCASGAQAVGLAAGLVRTGAADAALAGGSDVASVSSVRRAWRGHDTVLGDGAGMIILESAASAAARGAKPLAEIVGFGMATGAPEAAIWTALDEAGLHPAAIGRIEVSGVDRSEAWRGLFGDNPPPMTSIAAQIGHTLGASGVLGMIAAIAALKRGECGSALCACFAFGGLDAALILTAWEG